jgi:heme-degrading monooxygenase HmoA
MFARYFTFQTTAENRPEIERMADDIYRHSATLPGFVSATYVISDDETSYGSFSVWQSREEAEAGGESIREKVMQVLQGLVTAPPEVSVMEIYEPK